jgi:CHASE2 domain-containing sensor protein
MANLLKISISVDDAQEFFNVRCINSSGKLPVEHDLFKEYQKWADNYHQLLILNNSSEEIRAEKDPFSQTTQSGTNKPEIINKIKESKKEVKEQFEKWLNYHEFTQIKLTIDAWFHDKKDNENIILIETRDDSIKKLPWHFWNEIIFSNKTETPNTEVILLHENSSKLKQGKGNKFNILVVRGGSDNSTQKDIEIFQDFQKNLNNVYIDYLPEEGNILEYEALSRSLRKNKYDMMYFCGHSGTPGMQVTPELYHNLKEDNNYSFKKAVEQGLKLIIFNSCDGLDLVPDFVPCAIVMKKKIEDTIAHAWIKTFLEEYKKYPSIYLSLNKSRGAIGDELQHKVPCNDWLPVIIQNTADLVSLPALIRPDDCPLSEDDDSSTSKDEVFSKILIPILITAALSSALGSSYLNLFKQGSPRNPTTTTGLTTQSDQIIGCYKWLNNLTIEVFADGTAIQFDNNEGGKWKVNKNGKYKYTFIWNLGWRQDVNFLSDGTVEGLNTEPNGTSYEFSAFKKLESCKSDRSSNYKKKLYKASIVAAVASLLTTAIISSARSIGWLESLELKTYDRMMQARDKEPQDDRIVVIQVTDRDVDKQPDAEKKNQSLSDESLDKLLKILHKYKPKVIGLDNILDRNIEAKYTTLNKSLSLKDDHHLIVACKVQEGDRAKATSVPVNAKLVGFADTQLDSEDKTIRRHLLSMDAKSGDCNTQDSLSYLLAYNYLDEGRINLDNKTKILTLGEQVVSLMQNQAGAYQNLDPTKLGIGSQILLNYRSISSPKQGFKSKSLQEIFDAAEAEDSGKVGDDKLHDLINNKIVIIGTTDQSRPKDFRDEVETPYGEMRGVFLQAHMTSQLINAASKEHPRPLIFAASFWEESLIIFGFSVVGAIVFSVVSGRYQVLILLGVSGAIVGLSLPLSAYVLLNTGYWFPLMPAVSSLLLTGILIKAYLNDRVMSKISHSHQNSIN